MTKVHIGLMVALLLPALGPSSPCRAAGTDRLGDPLPEGALQRLGTLRLRYGRGIGDLCYLADGHAVIAVGNALELWDMSQGALVRRLTPVEASIRSVYPRSTGTVVLIACADGRVAECDVATGSLERGFASGIANIQRAVYATGQERVLLTGSRPPVIEQWNLEQGQRQVHIDGEMHAFQVAIYGPGETTAFVSGSNGSGPILAHYNLEDGTLLRSLKKDYYAHARSLVLSPDGQRLLLGSRHMATEWALDDYRELRLFRGHHGHAVTAVAYGPAPEHLYSGSRDGSIRLWDRLSGEVLQRWFAHSGHVTRMELSPDRRWVLSYGGGAIAEHGAVDGRPRLSWERHREGVQAVACFPGGERLVSASSDGSLRLWEARSGRCIQHIESVGQGVYCVGVGADDRRLAAGSKDGLVREFHPEDGQILRTLTGHRGYVRALAYDAQGRLFSAADDGRVLCWGATGEQPVNELRGHRGGVLALALSAAGTHCLSGGRDGSVRLWDLRNGRQVRILKGHFGWIRGVAFLPGGQYAVSVAQDEYLFLWNLEDGSVLRQIELPAVGCAVATDAHGRHAFAARSDGSISICDLRTGGIVSRLSGHDLAVNSLAVSAAGDLLVTASEDSTLLVWDALAATGAVPAP